MTCAGRRTQDANLALGYFLNEFGVVFDCMAGEWIGEVTGIAPMYVAFEGA